MNTVTFTFQTSILYDSTGTPVYGCTWYELVPTAVGIPVPKYRTAVANTRTRRTCVYYLLILVHLKITNYSSSTGYPGMNKKHRTILQKYYECKYIR